MSKCYTCPTTIEYSRSMSPDGPTLCFACRTDPNKIHKAQLVSSALSLLQAQANEVVRNARHYFSGSDGANRLAKIESLYADMKNTLNDLNRMKKGEL